MSLLQEVNLWGEDIPFLSGLREKGRRLFAQNGLPTAKTEAWKYTRINEAALQNPQIDEEPSVCDGHCHHSSNLPFAAVEVKYCNGKTHLEAPTQIKGLQIKSLAEALFDNEVKPYLNKSFDMEKFPFAALNTSYLQEGLFILIEKGAEIIAPLYIHYHNHADKNRLNNIRNIIVAENGSRAVIVEHFSAEDGARYTQNIVNEIYISSHAELRHYTWQNEATEACHIALNSVQIKQEGKYSAFSAHGGCVLSRHESYIRLLQENAKAVVNGVYRLINDKQVCDITTNIRHLAPRTYSSQLVKGVAQAAGRGVFQGQIHIAKDAQQCEGYQLHRSLMLDDNAEIDCKPELEIYADDVKCSHGAAGGYLDKEQLFYMLSRGISEEEARKILIEAYLNEVFNQNTDTAVSEFINAQF